VSPCEKEKQGNGRSTRCDDRDDGATEEFRALFFSSWFMEAVFSFTDSFLGAL